MQKKLIGSTLLETLVALVIILSISGTAASVSVKIEQENNVLHLTRAEILAVATLNEIRTGKSMDVLTYRNLGYRVEKAVALIPNSNLYHIVIRVFKPDGKLILEKNIYSHESASN